eukprot:6434395-Pyramimonas_sp.AAC.1
MLMRRRADGGAADFLHVHGTAPTHLCVLDGSSAEFVHAALRRQLDLPCDGPLRPDGPQAGGHRALRRCQWQPPKR